VIDEGAGALALAAAVSGKAGDGPIVCVVGGGNVDLMKFAELVDCQGTCRRRGLTSVRHPMWTM
jgi:threonine dehydratase